ncbi:MAG: hypothetical protein R2776_08125 [Flavobacteriaceae bacterium]|nr:hypothetical protein [Flavobacteriaceae bacterium]
MAKQKGIVPLVGTLGGLNFYYLKGKPVVRVAGGGFNGKAIKTKPSMQRVRENGAEFGHCSRVNKAFRRALQPLYAGHHLGYFHSRLMTLFTQLKDLDATSKRGQRKVSEGVATPNGLLLLQQFAYTPDCILKRVVPYPMEYDAASHTLTIIHFDIQKLPFAVGATHVELCFGVLGFDFETLEHELYLDTPRVMDTAATDSTLVFQVAVPPNAPGIPMGVLGVRFYQEVNEQLYKLNSADSVGFGVIVSSE